MPHKVCLEDLQFKTLPRRVWSSGGGAVATVFERIGVPKIPASVLNAVFYLYESRADAEAGQNPGGTGFIIGWNKGPSLGGPHHFYAVTNWHVAVDDSDPESPPCPVIRLNNKDRTPAIIELRPADWKFIPDGLDVAVTPIEIDPTKLQYSYIPTDMFASPEDIWNEKVATGDDVFMIGLFFDHNGKETNVPSSRFGNISVLPNASYPIRQPTGLESSAYILDMHSRSGYSGSPVFMYRTPGQDLTTPIEMQFRVEITKSRLDKGPLTTDHVRVSGETVFRFLGIHYGQFPEYWEQEIANKNIAKTKKRGLITDGAYVKGWSGMTIVIPAWDIINVLELIPEIKQMRDDKDAERLRSRTRLKTPVPEKARKDDDANPEHKKSFNALLDAAAQKQKLDD